MSFLPADYEKVEDRIRAFYIEHPQGRIITQEIGFDHKEVRFRAEVFRDLDPDPHPAATGHAHGFVGQEKDYEKCETVAIGRALANLNYAKQGARASAEEMEAYERVKVEPTRHPVGNATGPLANHRAEVPITPAQLKMAKDLLRDVDEGINIVTEHLGGYRPPEMWTKYEASGDKGADNGLISKLIAAKKTQMGGARKVTRTKGPAPDEGDWHNIEPPEDMS